MSVELLLKARLRIGSPPESIHRNFEFSAANAADSECRSGVKPFDDPNARRLCSPSCDGCRLVFDPPWHSGLMSDAAKLQLGFDLDYDTTQASPPIYGERK